MSTDQGRRQRRVRRCLLCGHEVDVRLAWPHPMSATVDPLAARVLGGAGLDAPNLVPVHLGCRNVPSIGKTPMEHTSRDW